MIHPIHGTNGIFTGDDVRKAVATNNRHAPRTKIVNIENTANSGGGVIWPLAAIEDVASAAHENDMVAHMDGARLLNAVVESGIPATEFTQHMDSVWLDFSKGLGCPIGAVLAGSNDFIDEAFRVKQQFGGALRQSGIVTSACLYALDHHVELPRSHARCYALGCGCCGYRFRLGHAAQSFALTLGLSIVFVIPA
jgi:threonine aldolase